MILIDATPLQSEHRVRGVGTYVYYLTRELSRLSNAPCEFFVSAQDRSQLPPWIAPAHALYRPHRPAQVYWLYNEWAIRHVVRRTRPEVFHATDFNGLVNFPDVPTVATLHDLTGFHAGVKAGSMSQRLSTWRWNVYYHEKLPKASHIIAVSSHVKQDAMQQLGIDPQKISVIPHGVDTETLSPRHKGEGRYADQPPYLLYMGSAEPHKNLPRLIQAFRLVANSYPEMRLYLGGRWQEKDRLRIQELIAMLHLEERVNLLGYVDPEDKPSALANATAVVLLSLTEGFGLPVVEGMASGVPVVASDIPVFREVAENAALLVDPEDVESIAQGLETMLESQDLRGDYSQRGIMRADQHSWATVAEKTLLVYQKTGQSVATHESAIL